MDYLVWAEETFRNDIYAAETTGIQILEVDAHYAKCKMPITQKHMNANHAVMGGAIFTLADFAFAIAANTEGILTVSLTSQISFLRPGGGSALYAEALCLKTGRTTSVFQVNVTDEEGMDVAVVNVTGFRSNGVSLSEHNT